METRRLVLTLTAIAVALILVIGVLSLIVLVGGDSDGTTAGDSPDLPDRVSGELRLFGPDPVTMDPACASDAGSAQYIVEIFSGLVSFDREFNLVPDIAEDWEVSADGTVYTFNLRNNVLFHDGSRRVTADDFKFSIERALAPRLQSTVANVYLDDIVGALEYNLGDADGVEGVQVIDPNTLEITIREPSSVFLQKLSYPTAFVVDQRQVGDSTCFEGANWQRNPNATGPFQMADWALGQRIVLEPNDSYYGDPKPSLARVTFVLSGGSPLIMYENDEIDITGIGINDIDRIRDPNEPLNVEFREGPSLDVFYIGFNVEEPPFDDVRVRQALAMALDKELLALDILEDLVVPAVGILPPGMPGYNPDLEGLPFDPEEAQRLLDDAGGPGIFRDVFLKTTGRGASPGVILEAITAMWEQNLGVRITIEQEDFGLFLRSINDGNFQMFSLGWIADYPDPSNFLEIKLHSESANNDNFYGNPQVDALLDQALHEEDEDERSRLYQEAERLIVADSPWIPLYHGKSSYLVKPYVQGFESPAFIVPNLKYVSIER